MGFRLNIHNQSTGATLGGGPILSVTRYQQTQRLTKSGTWGADLVATEPRIQHTHATPSNRVVDTKRLVRCHLSNEQGTRELGAGVIDTLGITAADYGMDIGGNDLSVLLGNPTVHALELSDAGLPLMVKEAVETIGVVTGLTLDTTTYLSEGDTTNGNITISNVTNISNFSAGDPILGAGIPDGAYVDDVSPETNSLALTIAATATATGVTLHTNQIVHTFAGESKLAALIWLANAVGEDWRLEGDEIVWLYRTRESCGLRAVSAVDPVAALGNDTIVIIPQDGLQYQRASAHVFNRIFPYGAGSGDARETIAGIDSSDFMLPDGFSYGSVITGGATYYYIQHDDSVDDNGPIERSKNFSDITSPTELAQVALVELQRNLIPLDTISLTVEKVAALIKAGQSIHLEYRENVDSYQPLRFNEPWEIQQVTSEVGVDGSYVTGLQLSNQRRWPVTIGTRLEQLATEVETLSSYGQPAARAISADTAGSVTSPVVAVYTTNAGQSIPNNTNTIVDYEDLEVDTHSCVTPGSGWIFTAPYDGYYYVAASALFVGTTAWAAGTERATLQILVNGVAFTGLDRQDNHDATSHLVRVGGPGRVIHLVAGDTISIAIFQTTGGALALFSTNALNNWVSIFMVGMEP